MIGTTPEYLNGELLDWAFSHDGERYCIGIERSLNKARCIKRKGSNEWELFYEFGFSCDEANIVNAFGSFQGYILKFAREVSKAINASQGNEEELDPFEPNSELGKLILAIQNNMEYVEDSIGNYIKYNG